MAQKGHFYTIFIVVNLRMHVNFVIRTLKSVFNNPFNVARKVVDISMYFSQICICVNIVTVNFNFDVTFRFIKIVKYSHIRKRSVVLKVNLKLKKNLLER